MQILLPIPMLEIVQQLFMKEILCSINLVKEIFEVRFLIVILYKNIE